MSKPGRSKLRVLLKVAAWASIVMVPILGTWLGSSFVMMYTRAGFVGLLVALSLFPALPLAWELWATRRARRRAAESDTEASRLFGLSTRLILRTLVIHVGILSLGFGFVPDLGVVAVSARGDWFVDSLGPGAADVVRPVVWGVASLAEYALLGDTIDEGSDEIWFGGEYEAADLELVTPTRGPVRAHEGAVEVVVRNPRGVPLFAYVRTGDSLGAWLRSTTPCRPEGTTEMRFTCPTPPGDLHTVIVGNREASGCPNAVTFQVRPD